MNFVSYAQNFEDVMLWRALKHVENGLYVDVGAQHPRVDSVSRAFYEHGWRGVHIEPVQAYADLLRADRPDETVLQVALSDAEGVLELKVIPETGLSTAVDAYAERHLAEHGFAHTVVPVPMLTLKSALRWLEGKEVHWLKIDVEGLEEKVLRGWDPAVLRPWVMVIEATVPTSTETDYAGWEPLVTGAGYRFAWFDGLNRFYVAEEHPELLAAFATPPNVFDAARLSGLASSELCRGVQIAHDAEMARLREQAIALEAELAELRERAATQGDELALARRKAQDAEHSLATEHERATKLQAEVAALRDLGRLQAHIDWMQGQWEAAMRKAEELNRAAGDSQAAVEQLRRDLQSMHASTSWRITAPVRRTADLIRWATRLPVSTARAGAGQSKRVVRGVLRRALSNPAVKTRALRLLAAAPGLELGVRRLALRAGLTVSPHISPVAQLSSGAPAPAAAHEVDERVLRELSPRATRILEEIRKVIDTKAH
ncbi:MAG: FkbM family methyltransferase [Pseudomonadota bacterium]